MVPEVWIVGLSSVVAAAAGAVGGFGGAIFVVPALIFLGMAPVEAAPLGLLTVAAGSLAANAAQVNEFTVNHRLGVTVELPASAGAIAGAMLAGSADPWLIRRILALALAAAVVAGALGRDSPTLPDGRFGKRHLGEWRHGLAGAYVVSDGQIVPYRARRLSLGVAVSSVSGLVAGLTGTGGGYMKTPIMSELMHVPVKVAAATTMFMVGLTASAALLVFAIRGDLDPLTGMGAVIGGLVGGRAGAALQGIFPPAAVRRFLAGLLLVVAIVLVLPQ